ncbi:MAG: ABC transporter permease, partial [Actinobacteria bacterium]|nr:ABC transporter permease [Actinomycetota bacterium]
MTSVVRRALQRSAMFVASLALVVAVWETYKALGPEDGGQLIGVRILP